MSRRRENRTAAERLDVLEPPPPQKGCNASYEGHRCGQLVVTRQSGPLSVRRLCAWHSRQYLVHDAILARIRAL